MVEFAFPVQLVFEMHEANYAVSRGESFTDLDFVTIREIKPYKTPSGRHPKTGRARKHVGCRVMRTRHGDNWINRYLFKPNGNVVQLSAYGPSWAASTLARIITDQRRAAARYGQELGQCCRCGKALTDARSRWYGIGPECEKHWPELVFDVNESRGEFAGGADREAVLW